MPTKLTAKQKEAWKLLDSDISELLLYGGSRSGKTFVTCRYILLRALMFPRSFHLIGRMHLSDLKSSIISDTMPKVAESLSPNLALYWKNHFHKGDFKITFPNEACIWFNGFADARRTEKALGNEYSTIFLNEVSQMTDYRVIEKLLTRLAQNVCFNRAIYDCNPTTTAHWAYRKFMDGVDPTDRLKKDFDTAYLLMNPTDNAENLPKDYIEKRLGVLSKRQKNRFKLGLFATDVEGAVFKCEDIERNRAEAPAHFDWVSVAIDPSVSEKSTSDDCGIVVGGRNGDHAYVIADYSANYTPAGWAKKAIWAYHIHKADHIVAEVNNGGAMIKTVIQQIDANVPVEMVHATRGKAVRAEPVAAKYEQDFCHHTQIYDELEGQMTGWTVEESYSPDRMDALVWLMYDLLIEPTCDILI